MSLTKKAVELSNGAWVSNKIMLETLGITPQQNPMRNIVSSKSIISEVVSGPNGELLRYRAFYHEGKSSLELAKMRKRAGILAGIESFRFGNKEQAA